MFAPFEKPANFFGLGDFLNFDGQCRGAVGNAPVPGKFQHAGKRGFHAPVEPFVDLGFGPEKTLQALDPLEVSHGHASGVAENVGKQRHVVALFQNPVGLGRGGVVGFLRQNSALDFGRDFQGDDHVPWRQE